MNTTLKWQDFVAKYASQSNRRLAIGFAFEDAPQLKMKESRKLDKRIRKLQNSDVNQKTFANVIHTNSLVASSSASLFSA